MKKKFYPVYKKTMRKILSFHKKPIKPGTDTHHELILRDILTQQTFHSNLYYPLDKSEDIGSSTYHTWHEAKWGGQ